MRFRKTWILGAALCGALLCGANAQAGMITFLAIGTFSNGTSTYDNSISTVTYTSLGSSTATTPTNVSLGTFTTTSSASDASPNMVSDTFTLTITDTTPGSPMGVITFTATMSGTLSMNSSNASMQFTSMNFITPLSQTLDGFRFTIVNADNNTPGNVNLAAPTTNMGMSTINAQVTMVPEPASVVLLGLAVPALAGLAYRRTRR